MTLEQLARVEAKKGALLLEMTLRELRRLLGVTQTELALRLKTTQGEVSQAERRDDSRLSTLRRYVEALGGKVEIIADFGDKRIKLVP
jgi:transcriptional regulator with XRE-family HTH domain